MNQPVKQLSMRHISVFFLALVAWLASGPATAREIQELSAIHEAVTDFITAEHDLDADLHVSPSAIDSRLRLARCEEPLRAFWAAGSRTVGNTTVGISCGGKRPWKLYVPAHVRLMQPVVVANRALARGQHLAAKDLRIEKRDVGDLHRPAIRDPAQVLGYLVYRAIAPGNVVDARMLRAPVLVERGRRVRMLVHAQGVSIAMSGEAMEDGALGETVKVRNISSRKIVEGVVSGPAAVRLDVQQRTIKTALKQ